MTRLTGGPVNLVMETQHLLTMSILSWKHKICASLFQLVVVVVVVLLHNGYEEEVFRSGRREVELEVNGNW